ncbi:MAG: PAS domain S-box protein [Bacteroidales bacterium]
MHPLEVKLHINSLVPLVTGLLTISFLLTLVLMVYPLKQKKILPSKLFGFLMLDLLVWILLKIFTLFIHDTETSEILQKINIVIVRLVPSFLLLIAIFQFKTPKWFNTKHIKYLFVVPAFVLLLILLSPFQNYLYDNFKLTYEFGIPIQSYHRKPLLLLCVYYDYALFLMALIILAISFKRSNLYLRKQILYFIIGILLPLTNDILFVFGYSPIKNYNLAPLVLSFGNLFFIKSVYGFGFFNALSAAHKSIIEMMPDIVIIVDPNGNVIDLNKSGKEFFNFNASNPNHQNAKDIFSEFPTLLNLIEGRIKADEIWLRKEQKDMLFSVSKNNFGYLFPDKNLNIFVLHDITNLQKTDVEIRRLSTAIEQSPITIVITDVKGRIEYVNPAFCRITGYSAEEAIGNNPRVLKGLTPQETFIDLWQTVLSGKVWQGEFINRKKSGEYYYEEAVIAPVRDWKDEIVNFIAIKNDITKRKKVEEKLQKSEEKLKIAQSIGNVGHWEYSNKTGDLFWSEQMFHIYEVDSQEFKPTYQKVVELFHPDDRQKVEQEFELSVKNRNKFEIQHRIITPTGKVKYVIERSTTSYDQDGMATITIGSVADITPLKLAEEELAYERALLRSLIDSVPDYIFMKDLNGVYKLANESIKNFFGVPWQQIIGKTDFSFVDKPVAEFFIANDLEVIKSGKSKTDEELVTYYTGEKVWLETIKTPFVGIDGNINGIIGVSRNINARKESELALQQSQANLLAIVENTNDNIWAVDALYKILFANKQFTEAFKLTYGTDLLKGSNILDALPLPLKAIWKERYNRALANERFMFEEQFEIAGTVIYFEISMNPIVAENKVIGVSVFSRNITDRKNFEIELKIKNKEIEAQHEEQQQMNEELKMINQALYQAKAQAEESEELFKQLLNYSPVYIFIKDLNLRFVRFSSNYETFMGRPFYEIIGKTNEEIWPYEIAKEITREDEEIMLSNKPMEVEFELNERFYNTIKFPILLEGKNRYLAGYILDITERKKAEHKIHDQNKELLDLNATKDKFFSIIAHDLRSPFNAIIGFSEHLSANLEECTPEEIKLFAGNINTSALQTYRLLENLLEWSRLQRGIVKAEIKNTNLKNLVDEILSLKIENAKAKGVSLSAGIPENIKVNCDQQMTKTIIRNLVSNAIKFTRSGGKIEIKAEAKNNMAEISVSDTGIGISEEVLPFIFSIDKNITTRGTDNESGTGLGLILCKELTEIQRGKIWAESKSLNGSTFFFTLPLANLSE